MNGNTLLPSHRCQLVADQIPRTLFHLAEQLQRIVQFAVGLRVHFQGVFECFRTMPEVICAECCGAMTVRLCVGDASNGHDYLLLQSYTFLVSAAPRMRPERQAVAPVSLLVWSDDLDGEMLMP